MTNKDLIDLAPAYALKNLDERQDADFTVALDRAPRHIQALVWDVITRTLTGIEATLPAVQPAPALRPRTLGAVGSAIAGEKVGAAAGATPAIVGRIQAPRRTVNPLWRAAAIGCAAAALMLGFTSLQMHRNYADLDAAINSNQLAVMFERDFGQRFESTLFSPESKFVQFASADNSNQAKAIMIVDAKAGAAQLFCRDLPHTAEQYQLAIVGDDGRAERVLATFSGRDQRVIVQMTSLPDLAGRKLAILPVGENASAVLTSRSA